VNLAGIQRARPSSVLRKQPVRHGHTLAMATLNTTSRPGPPPTACPWRSMATTRGSLGSDAAGGRAGTLRRRSDPDRNPDYRTVGHHEGDPIVASIARRTNSRSGNTVVLLRCRAWLESVGVASPGDFEEIDRAVAREIQDAIDFAETSPLPDPRPCAPRLGDPINPVEAPPRRRCASPCRRGELVGGVRDGWRRRCGGIPT